MKRFLLILGTVLSLMLPLNVSAAEPLPAYQLNLGEDYTVVSANQTDLAAAALGLSQEQFSAFRKQNHTVLVAANQDRTVRLSLSAHQNDFSRSAKSFSGYEAAELETLMGQFLGNGISGSIVYDTEKLPFFRLRGSASDESGSFYTTQYLTVYDSTEFTLFIEIDEKSDRDLADRLFRKLSVGEQPKENAPVLKYLIFGGIAVFGLLIIFLVCRIVKDLKEPRE